MNVLLVGVHVGVSRRAAGRRADEDDEVPMRLPCRHISTVQRVPAFKMDAGDWHVQRWSVDPSGAS